MDRESHRAYQVERLSSEIELDALRPAWTELLGQAPGATVFQTWEWVSTWWRHHEPGWELWLLTACNEEGQLAGIAPLVWRRHVYGPLAVRRLAFAGDHLAYRVHLDMLARPEQRAEVAAAFVSYLDEQPEWDVLDLEALDGESPVASALAQAAGHFHRVEELVCPYVALPATWADFERRHLSNDHRKWLRNRRSRLEKDYAGQVAFSRASSAEDLARFFGALATLHQKRWHGKGQGSSFDHVSYAGFQREMAGLALEQGWLRLYVLWVAGQPVAAEYSVLYRGKLFNYAKAFDPAWSRYSPGQLLLAHMIQDAIAEGVAEFDMGRGTFDYKFRWGDQSRSDVHVQLSRGAPGHAWAYGTALYRKVKRMAAQRTPPGMREWINRRGGKRVAKSDVA